MMRRTSAMARGACVGTIVAVVLSIGVLAASGSGKATDARQASDTVSVDPVSLKLWWWGGDDAKGLGKFLKQAVAEYHALHPNVTITPVEQTTEALIPAFNAAAAAKKGPDVQYFWGGIWGLENAWKGAITPVSDYIPKSELAHYLNASEDTYDGKVWTMPWQLAPSFPVMYRKDVFKRAGVVPPTTWKQMLAACDAFHALGSDRSLFAGGIKDGWFGGWLYTIIGQQGMSSVSHLLDAVTGKNGRKLSDPALAAFWYRLDEMRQHHCWNDDIGSVQLYEGQQAWLDGKAAMTVTGTISDEFVKKAGASNIVVTTMPVWGKGQYARKIGSSSQTLGITKWSKHPKEAADFLQFLHTPGQLKKMYFLSETFPADDRVKTSWFKRDVDRQVWKIGKVGGPYLENFIPTQLDAEGIIKHAQLVLGGNEKPAAAIAANQALVERLRSTQRRIMKNFAVWAESYR